ncbi:glycosyltransferase family 2 protein [Shimia sp. CNT1-13L.2]|uniref:glycosyltransferase family 2 protein n=1 Tax=Shimia sp. CNT1-13L.2 TaxID=2959663 RepID=UPI0020CDBC9E|nr:glycosyltransferase family 2 protein [Shimia sp. CNT1-13L.2]MCP9482708.1 glycosyltransferase family 2 protein [Shimia sp. CNT1-13L.2]
MKYGSLKEFLDTDTTTLAKGPVALIFAEDRIELETTLRHHLELGFKAVLVFMPDAYTLPEDIAGRVIRIREDRPTGQVMIDTVNTIIEAAPGIWLYYCFNAEYLFFPFCESRNVSEMATFHMEERRYAMLTYVIDLYANDLESYPDAVSLDHAMLDKSGYYALARPDTANHNHPKERQLDFFGGLRWRYEEHIPAERRKIDRISLFMSKPDLQLRPDFTFSDEEYNTYSCEWHNNLTAAVCSFRTAKALKTNPGSTFDIRSFTWHNSVPFEWHSRQLLDLGLMEPGQWF